ncbi:PDZ domain-containing protein [Foetidibacter luteolus]|uniref:PDZ domain-containing protein n=1 Tax=Foetidibacter luteolus TaxID=2608880 RepID=UPI001F2ED679|nr:PDZ domain-containing protein [Foetidibacter luteolus]
MKNFFAAAFALYCMLCLLPVRAQLNIYVSTNGNNNNKGTLTHPLKTVSKALVLAKQKATGSHVNIQLRGGTYYLNNSLQLHAEDITAASVTISGYRDEQVNISAGRRLRLQWKPYRNGIYQAAVTAGVVFERLYINNQPQVLARYPNFDSSARVFNGTAADALSPQRVKQWKNPAGGYVHALHAHEWGGFHYRIKSAAADGELQLEGGWQNNRPNDMHKEHRFVENIFEELDAPGEWWLDKDRHILYYYPPAHVKLPQAVVDVSQLKNSIELLGSVEKPLKNVRITNLNFIHNERSFWETKEPLLRSDWTIYRGGAILLEGTENCSITNCSFGHIGGNAIMFSNYNKQDTVSGCHIAHIGANAVCFIGDTKSVRSPSFRYEDYTPYDKLDKTPGPLTNNYPQQCVVTDNLLHNLGEIEKQATGVQIEISSAITVSHNSIYNTPRAGINIGDGCFGGHLLEYNDVFNSVLETGDHGAFNSWGRDRYWSPDRNYMDSITSAHPELILLDAQQTTTIRNNRFRCDHGWDIDLDDGSSNYHIYNNVCLNGGLKLREGFYRVVENNVLVNNSFHPHVWFNNSGDVFKHNIVMKPYFPIQVNNWGKEVDYNLFPDSIALQQAQQHNTDVHSKAGDPLFTNAAAGDYTVPANSPALAAGFINFSMNSFGVQKPSLKRIAEQPAIPMLMNSKNQADKSATISFLGGKIKSIDGLGDRSAYGLPDETGVVVLDAVSNSLLAKSGLQAKDVIRKADGKAVKEIKDLLEVNQSSNWKGKIPVEIIRNQQVVKLELLLK